MAIDKFTPKIDEYDPVILRESIDELLARGGKAPNSPFSTPEERKTRDLEDEIAVVKGNMQEINDRVEVDDMTATDLTELTELQVAEKAARKALETEVRWGVDSSPGSDH
jgi:hypothetical protein